MCDSNSLLQYHIEDKKNNNNEFLKNIINNINDPKSRYMLIQIKSSLGKLIFHTIKNYESDIKYKITLDNNK